MTLRRKNGSASFARVKRSNFSAASRWNVQRSHVAATSLAEGSVCQCVGLEFCDPISMTKSWMINLFLLQHNRCCPSFSYKPKNKQTHLYTCYRKDMKGYTIQYELCNATLKDYKLAKHVCGTI